MKKQLHVHAIRHGEIILQPVSKMPKSEKQLATKHIVGHSETGVKQSLSGRKTTSKSYMFAYLSQPNWFIKRLRTSTKP